MFEREYLFNPFMLKTCSDEELSKQINLLADNYIYDSDLAPDIVFNINLESDLLTIYGEFIARLTERVLLIKLDADRVEDKAVFELRNDWVKTNDGKAPNLDYFKAQASAVVEDKRKKQYEYQAMLERFKKAYDSLETKQNALKKKLELIKYELS